MSSSQRSGISIKLRERGLRTVWQQVDREGISDPVQQADFLLRRLYPEMREEWFGAVVAALAALHAAGKWHGFERPE